jgi:hypothetical protein
MGRALEISREINEAIDEQIRTEADRHQQFRRQQHGQ